MNLVIIGMPGAGKGTQSAFICSHYGIPHISTGDMLRKAAADGTPLGLQAAELINKGQFVSDDTVREIVSWRLSLDDCRNGFLLDGYPRNLHQAEALDEIMSKMGITLTKAIELSASPEVVLGRLCSRKVCPKCEKVFNGDIKTCDACGSVLKVRDDDKEDVILNRIRIYREQTAVLTDFYNDKGILVQIESEHADTPEDVWNKIKSSL